MLNSHLDTLCAYLKPKLSNLSSNGVEESCLLPIFSPSESQTDHYSHLIEEKTLDTFEHTILLLALIPHIRPHFFDPLLPKKGNYPQIGGIRGKHHRGFLPTGETALFLLAGDDLQKRFQVQEIFSPDHWFAKERVLWLAAPEKDEPPMSGRIVINRDYVALLTTGRMPLPSFSMAFPAAQLETKLDWEDLVLATSTLQQVKELEAWLEHQQLILEQWGMGRKVKPGYRALFYGPPGTGKTLTATLLGKANELPVFRVDLSMVVSKYIGETEKNLSNLFARAAGKNWILFFDEADALFGKRTDVRDAHDKYANQEVAYLLQRIESYNGLVILASNQKNNIDEAFIRRFQSIIYFPKPGPSERLQLWRKAFPQALLLAEDVSLEIIARDFELTGSNIVNVVQYLCLVAAAREKPEITKADIIRGIQREYVKEGRVV